jgi:hypothetical protein
MFLQIQEALGLRPAELMTRHNTKFEISRQRLM